MRRFVFAAAIFGLLIAIPLLHAESLFIEVGEAGAARVGNAMPARVHIDFREVLHAPDARIDPSALTLVRLAQDGRTPDAPPLPVRFDDPDPKPDSFFHDHVGGGGVSGDLVFTHVSTGAPRTRYRLDYTRWTDTARLAPASPTPQLGDYDILRYAEGPMSGVFHTKIAVADWDHDGAPDIIAGDGLGAVTLYRRLGADPARFDVPRFLQVDGQPLDTGWTAAVEVADWDSDGDLDLLVGEEGHGWVLFVENAGTRDHPRLLPPKPLLDVKGELIVSPHEPVAEMSFFKKDYSPSPRAVDYNGDGKLDLVFGGYVTGQVFYYENVSPSAGGMPQLEARGALRDEDDQVIDVSWSAAPEFADLDSDGDLDLLIGHVAERKDRFKWVDAPSAYYYENVGTRAPPKWRKQDFPLEARWTPFLPDVTIPRLADWDGDDDLDMLMSGRCEVFRFENVGTPAKAQFVFRGRLTMPHGPFLVNYNLNAVAPCLGDLNGDGLPDLLRGGSGSVPLALMTEFGNTPRFRDAGTLQAAGREIYHEFVHGDDTSFPFLFDWDGDGDLDLLLGDGAGYVWYYRNDGDKQHARFAEGRRFQLADGQDLCVGLPTPDEAKDFEQHSGNRAVPAPGDYDGDGQPDLICGNADGKVYFYRNTGQGAFAAGAQIAEGNNRCFTWPVDWDGDGRLDVVLSWGGNPRAIYLNTGVNDDGVPTFAVQPIENMPWIPYPRPLAVDWNQDGDVDLLFASSYALLHFAERDFIEHGYVEAVLVSAATQEK